MNFKNHLTFLPIVAISVILGASIFYFYRTVDSIGKKLQNLDDNYKTLTNRFNDIEQKNRLHSEYNKNKKSNENAEEIVEEEAEEVELAASDVDGAELEDVELTDDLSLEEIRNIEEIIENEEDNSRIQILKSEDETPEENSESNNCESNIIIQDEEDDDENENLDEINMNDIGLPDNLSDASENELSEEANNTEEEETVPEGNETLSQEQEEIIDQMITQNKPKRSLIPPKKIGLARNFKEGYRAEDNGDIWEVVMTKRGTKRWNKLN